ncbi:MAG: diguanylate cyclase [Gallionella sp.]
MSEPNEQQVRLKLLCDAYAAQLPETLKQIDQVWEKLPRDRWDEENFSTLHRKIHSLSGSGKNFGFSMLGDVARSLESCLQQHAREKTVLNEAQCLHIQVLLSELHQVSMHRDAPEIVEEIDVARVGKRPAGFRHVFVVEDDPALAESLNVQLSYFGYEVSVYHTLSDFRLAMQSNPDVVVMTDITFPEDDWGGINVIKEIQQGRDVPVPVIFVTSHNEFKARLEAVRVGGIQYLSKPVNIGNLIDKLDELTSTLPPASYRVLIVDDSEYITSYYSTILEQAGMEVRAINDPFLVMESLIEFVPDLILLDLYMPECNGMEVARVIRQLDAFVGIPIVFLSAEGNLDKQLMAMGLGGDDFLTKPVEPQHLIASVGNRIKRSLVLRSLMVRDSLTGLLNHTAIKEQLAREVAQAKRQDKPLAFAMIDIDHFKEVNDTHGHPVGDRVIKSIARLLKQRLREIDIIGRYGGEEFAVILSNTDGETAAEVLDAIREDFSQLRHLADENEFCVSFSCGIAEVADFGNAITLCDAADKALYKAKIAGRNQVVRASGLSI